MVRLLDLFCGAGGSAVGYNRAGFDEIVGVDLVKQPRYPFTFIQADAMTFPLDGFDAIHASPPCQAYSPLGKFHKEREYPDLIADVRDRLARSSVPYVIENVPGAPLLSPVMLCGSSFGLDVRRHRLFETNAVLLRPPCVHSWQKPRFSNTGTRRRAILSSVVGVYGGAHFKGDNLAYRQAAMGIDWMQMDELSQAVPPCFTEFIGRALIEAIRA